MPIGDPLAAGTLMGPLVNKQAVDTMRHACAEADKEGCTLLAGGVAGIDRFKGKPLVVTCATGTRSGSAIRQLKAAGFTEIYALKGGMGAWREASLPVEK